ncbi:MAG: hypothetical protein QOE86_4306 [Solirubrobacteraceae bacterium]|nr:hypothetical protein [Solirubrobacteraceae bacterium]
MPGFPTLLQNRRPGEPFAPRGDRAAADDRSPVIAWAGALLVFGITVALFTRFGLDDTLRRDEAIYAYGGQQWANNGVPFETSIFDPKGPGAAALLALATLVARALSVNDLHLMRLFFFLFACGAVVGVYVLGLWLFESALAGLAAAITFASFEGFALDALGGPDAKMPGIFFAVVAMALLLRRRWFLGALAGSLAFLVWQPLVIYPAVAVVAAAVAPGRSERWGRVGQAVAGAAIPVAVTVVYYLLAGSLHDLFEGSVNFPLTGIQHGNETLRQRLDVIRHVVTADYGHTRWLFWGGLVLLPALAGLRLARGRSQLRDTVRDPFLVVVVLSFLGVVLFSATDFQGYPDLYPLLPYAALGIGGAVGLVLTGLRGGAWLRRVAGVVASLAVAALAVLTWHWYDVPRARDTNLILQRARAKKIKAMIGPGETLYAIGDPTSLVLTHRRNPSRYIYLGSAVGRWMLKHTPGHFAGWQRQVRKANPAVIVVAGWTGPTEQRTVRWLRSAYAERYMGHWQVFLTPDAIRRAKVRGISLNRHPAPGPKPS